MWMRGSKKGSHPVVEMTEKGKGKKTKRREPLTGNGGSQNIESGFEGPQATCRPPTTPSGQ
jgi:hypothetical protein